MGRYREPHDTFYVLNEKSINQLNFALNQALLGSVAPWQYNMLTRGAGRRALTRSEYLSEGVIIMSTCEELNLIVSVALLIVTILNLKNKK